MLLNELYEVSANPAYLRAAERSRSQAQATQRQHWTSPEEKAAARRTELKREKGMAGYSKRHRAANPDMYPTPKAQPAPRLRDPSTEYSDDYSVWAAGRRDTMEQGVAEMDKSQPSHGRDGRISHSTYGSRDRGGSAGQERTAKMTTADKMMKDAHKVMMKSMSDADKVKKGWRNPNM